MADDNDRSSAATPQLGEDEMDEATVGRGRATVTAGDGDTAAPEVAVDDELTLPKATVYKIITEMLPAGVVCPRETRDLLISCCVEFIHLLSSEANEICENAGRKTISPEHVVEALKTLGFGSYVEDVMAAHDEATEQAKEKSATRATNKLEKSGLTEEELLKQQEELFESARRKFLEQQQQQRTQQTETSIKAEPEMVE